jgi:hypothetical protein
LDSSHSGSPSLDNLEVIVISHTHWDREWYRPFQHFRMQLVEMLDGLLAIMIRRPDLTYFLLDGQSSLLEDYPCGRSQQLRFATWFRPGVWASGRGTSSLTSFSSLAKRSSAT